MLRISGKVRNLLALGTSKWHAIMTGLSSKGYWDLSRTLATWEVFITEAGPRGHGEETPGRLRTLMLIAEGGILRNLYKKGCDDQAMVERQERDGEIPVDRQKPHGQNFLRVYHYGRSGIRRNLFHLAVRTPGGGFQGLIGYSCLPRLLFRLPRL